MASTNKTPHYNLSQWIGSDKPTFLGDLNTDFSDIDTAIYEAKTTADTAETNAQSAITQVTAIAPDVANNKADIAVLKTTVTGQGTNITNIQNDVNKLKNAIINTITCEPTNVSENLSITSRAVLKMTTYDLYGLKLTSFSCDFSIKSINTTYATTEDINNIRWTNTLNRLGNGKILYMIGLIKIENTDGTSEQTSLRLQQNSSNLDYSLIVQNVDKTNLSNLKYSNIQIQGLFLE